MSFMQPNQNNQQGGAQQGGGAGAGGSLFGSSNPSSTASVFGAATTPNSTPGGGLFGPSNTNNSSTGSIFGGGSNPVPSSSGSIFGGGGTNLFGGSNTTPANNTPTPGGSLFGGSNTTSAATPKPSASGGGLLGFGQSTTPSAGSLFGGGASSSTPSSGGGLFGGSKPVEQSTTTKPPGQSLFGGGATSTLGTAGAAPAFGGLFGSTTPKPPDNTPASSGFSGGLFGSTVPKPAESTPASNPGTGALSGGLFGTTAPKPADNATGSAPSGTNLFAGGLFKKPDAPATTTTSTTTQSASLPFSLGGSNPTPSSTAAPLGSLFGNSSAKDAKPDQTKDASGEKKDAPGGSSGAPFSLFGSSNLPADKKDTPAAPSMGSTLLKEADKPATALGATYVQISAPPPSMLRGKTIEEIVNKWSSDLDVQVREFNKFATEVAVWDRALIENGNTLAALCNEMLVAEREQNDIDQSLEHIEQQQRDLLATLEAYEKTTEETLGGQGGSLRSLDTGPADTERDKNYMLATELHSHLDDLSGSLTQMIDTVNGLSLSSMSQQDTSSSGDDPMNQIAQILSSHLESLQWIDDSVRELEGQVSDVEKRVREAGVHVNGGGTANPTTHARSRSFGLGR